MKTLTEYINYNKNLFIDNIEYHFMLEYELRNNIRNNFNIINEKFGVYDGQVKFVIDFCKEIINNQSIDSRYYRYELDKTDLDNDYKNIFFKHIVVKYKSGLITGYVDNNNYDEKTKLMNYVIINIDKDEYNDYSSLVACLCHELTHAWDTYNSFIKGSKLKPSDISTSDSYRQSLDIIDTSAKSVCRRIYNNILKLEQNAYISELNTVLETNIDKISNYKDALDVFKQTQTWKQYSIFRNIVDSMKTNKIKQEFIDEFCNEYNDLNKTKLTNYKIIKKLDNILNKIFNKISTLIPKIYYDFYLKHKNDNVNENLVSGRQNNYMIEIMNILSGKYNTPIKQFLKINV